MKALLLLLMPVFSFGQFPGDFVLKGDLQLSLAIEKILFVYRGIKSEVRDSVMNASTFQFSGTISEPTRANLIITYRPVKNGARPTGHNAMIYLEPGVIVVSAKDSFQNKVITGSLAQTEFDALGKKLAPYNKKINELSGIRSQTKPEENEEIKRIDKEIEEITEQRKNNIIRPAFIANPSSPIVSFLLWQYAGPIIDPVKVDPLFAMLPPAIMQWPSLQQLSDRINIARQLAVGSYAPDFTQTDTAGKNVSLLSFRGKYVLVDFWASWCIPCRKENPNIVKNFEKYKDKGFTVLSVSLDRPNDKEKWLRAIRTDKLMWTHVSDLKFFDNAIARQYGITAIPQNLLVGPDGKIIGQNLKGEDLSNKLKEVIK